MHALVAVFAVAFASCSTPRAEPADTAGSQQPASSARSDGSASRVRSASAGEQDVLKARFNTSGSVREGSVVLAPSIFDGMEIDEGRGERAWPREAASARRISDAIALDIGRRHATRSEPARRDAHPKAHGCVRATFEVRNDLSNELAHGVLQPGARYRAWIRFSNGDGDPQRPDGKGDARGMAIKLVGIGGEKLSADERATQDFIMITHPVFFANDPERYAVLIERATSTNVLVQLSAALALGVRGALIARDIRSTTIGNPLYARYWSGVPYGLGLGAADPVIKFSARPCVARHNIAATSPSDDPDFLRKAMRKTLAADGACFDFLVQPRTSAAMSVEDSMTEWPEDEAPFIPVARISITAQDFDSPLQHAFCEDLSFSPWHALPAHRPLGAVNRVRRVVYDSISERRHALNDRPRVEPTGDETF